MFLALNETFRALEAHARRGLSDPPSLRDALSTTHKGLFTIGGAIEQTFTRDEGWFFLKLGESLERIYRTALVLRAKLPGLAAAEPRADVRALLHPVADAAAGARLARELSTLVRRPTGARAGGAVPAPRPAHAALAALRDGGGEGVPGAHRRRRRDDDRSAIDRTAARRALLPRRAPGRRLPPTSPSSTAWWTRWPRPTRRWPRSTSPPDDAARDRASLLVRVRRLHQRVVHASCTCSPRRPAIRPSTRSSSRWGRRPASTGISTGTTTSPTTSRSRASTTGSRWRAARWSAPIRRRRRWPRSPIRCPSAACPTRCSTSWPSAGR